MPTPPNDVPSRPSLSAAYSLGERKTVYLSLTEPSTPAIAAYVICDDGEIPSTACSFGA